MTAEERTPRTQDESGAILVLAMMFLLTISLIVGALGFAMSNDIHNISAFKASRDTLSAADQAVQAQIGAMRYVYGTTCPGTPYTYDGQSIVVTCTAQVDEGNSASRIVSFTAVPQGHSTVLVAAQVTFDDFSSVTLYKNDCQKPNPTTCGSGMSVDSWVVTPGH
jgi:hypothetical protein